MAKTDVKLCWAVVSYIAIYLFVAALRCYITLFLEWNVPFGYTLSSAAKHKQAYASAGVHPYRVRPG